MNEQSDDRLMESFAKGDVSALGTLYDRHHDRLYNYIYRLTGNPQRAEDLLQETFETLIREANRYQSKGKFKSWLFRIAHNRTVDLFRREKILMEKVIPINTPPDGEEPNPAENLEREEVKSAVRSALKKLPEEQKQVLLLKHFSGLTFRETAEILGIPLNTALGRMHYALRNLKKVFDGYGRELLGLIISFIGLGLF